MRGEGGRWPAGACAVPIPHVRPQGGFSWLLALKQRVSSPAGVDPSRGGPRCVPPGEE